MQISLMKKLRRELLTVRKTQKENDFGQVGLNFLKGKKFIMQKSLHEHCGIF